MKTPHGKPSPTSAPQVSRFFSRWVNGYRKKTLDAWHHWGLRGRKRKRPQDKERPSQGSQSVWKVGIHTEQNHHHFGAASILGQLCQDALYTMFHGLDQPHQEAGISSDCRTEHRIRGGPWGGCPNVILLGAVKPGSAQEELPLRLWSAVSLAACGSC